jgi:hypothetical protein
MTAKTRKHTTPPPPEFVFEAADGAEDQPVDTVPLFQVGDKVYTMPAVPGQADAVRMLREIRLRGVAFASELMLSMYVGDEGVDALINSKGFDVDRWNDITSKVTARIFGASDQGKED